MRISKIKLSGFKSFVDPTTLELPGNLSGIVGPNGCGKSNVIDALIWVMGESSAKHLRGDSMTDVIFNGSNTRKPVGQASVEIVFDNSDGTLAGQYASYAEVSIKRQITRDGLSVFYLNGTRCRRRDITGLLAGTGLGSRSYSVIEQGMISRVIEAKPEELRIFLEEAAGISKYKQRRRETENRIRHARENIERLDDIRQELEKQLNRLQRQARAAERYKELKAEERRLRAELLALRWRALRSDAEQHARVAEQRRTALESTVADLRAIETRIERLRDAQTTAAEAFNKVQSSYYGVGAEISRLEQQIQHSREKREALGREIDELQKRLADAEREAESDRGGLNEARRVLAELEPAHAGSAQAEEEASRLLNEAEQAMHAWQAEWDAFNQQASESSRNEQVERTRLEHLEDGLAELRQRTESLQIERDRCAPGQLEAQVTEAEARLEEAAHSLEATRERYERGQAELREVRELTHRIAAELDERRTRQQAVRGRLASLEALQQAALGKGRAPVIEWLRARGLDQAPRLAQAITVESGWEKALETVLGLYLEAVCVDGLETVASQLESLSEGALTAFDTRAAVADGSSPEAPPLAPLSAKVQSPWPMDSLLAGVYAADDLNAALALRSQLAAHESVVTREGLWLGRDWLQSPGDEDQKAGVLEREKAIRELEGESAALHDAITALVERMETARGRQSELEEENEGSRTLLQGEQERLTALHTELAALQTRLEQTRARREQIEAEIEELDDQVRVDSEEIRAARARLENHELEIQNSASRREHLEGRRDALRSDLQQAREQWRSVREQAHQMALQRQTLQARCQSLEQALERNGHLIEQFTARQRELRAAVSESESPMEESRRALEQALGRRMEVEGELARAREAVQTIDSELREEEQARVKCEQRIQEQRDQLEQVRVEAQAVEVRLQGLQEQLGGMGFDAEALLPEMPEEADETAWQQRLDALDQKIQRLGPINLAAIEEFAELSERKAYLDAQHADLSEALSTLEEAIRKIDRETRTRFKETYDKVNAGVQSMFPRLFGGGHAYLELTGDDLLETGVAIMARPPGKRNSSIHLLSGGEKALTAVSLVFAIFELNPAPFCLLDEVDAPLDDANVVRLCEMLRQMASRVQFLFITHNKITMEIAGRLIGVTMHEPGVSRLVAVDMDAAVEMAATA